MYQYDDIIHRTYEDDEARCVEVVNEIIDLINSVDLSEGDKEKIREALCQLNLDYISLVFFVLLSVLLEFIFEID